MSQFNSNHEAHNGEIKGKQQKTLVSLNSTGGEPCNTNMYLFYNSQIRPNNFTFYEYFNPHFGVIISNVEPSLSNGDKYEVPEDSKYVIADIIRIQEKTLKKHKDNVLISEHLFNWDLLFPLQNINGNKDGILWVTAQFDDEVVGPPQPFKIVNPKETKNELIGNAKMYDYRSIPKKKTITKLDELPEEICKKIEEHFNLFKRKQNQLGQNILHYMACFKNQACIQTMQKLVTEYRAIIDQKDSYGNTPLHYAQEFGNAQAFFILSHHGASNCLENNNGFSVANNEIRKDPIEKFNDLTKFKNINVDPLDARQIVHVLTSEEALGTFYLNKDTTQLLKFNNDLKSLPNFYDENHSQTKSKIIKKGRGPNQKKEETIEIDFLDEIQKGDVGNEKLGLRLLLIEKHTTQTITDESLLDLISPLTTFIHQRGSKQYQLAVCVGPWLLEWNETSFVIPKKMFLQCFLLCSTNRVLHWQSGQRIDCRPSREICCPME